MQSGKIENGLGHSKPRSSDRMPMAQAAGSPTHPVQGCRKDHDIYVLRSIGRIWFAANYYETSLPLFHIAS